MLGITPKAWSGADTGTHMCVCCIGWLMVPDFMLMMAVHASFLPGGREDTQCLLWYKTYIHSANPSKMFDLFEPGKSLSATQQCPFQSGIKRPKPGFVILSNHGMHSGRLQLCLHALRQVAGMGKS